MTELQHTEICGTPSLTFSSPNQTSILGCRPTFDLCHDLCWQHHADGMEIPAGQSSWPHDLGEGPSWRKCLSDDRGMWHRLAQMIGTLQEERGTLNFLFYPPPQKKDAHQTPSDPGHYTCTLY